MLSPTCERGLREELVELEVRLLIHVKKAQTFPVTQPEAKGDLRRAQKAPTCFVLPVSCSGRLCSLKAPSVPREQ